MSKTAFCFDLDGTLTKQETVPMIANYINLREEVNLLTELTMDGYIPFSSSFKLRVQLLASIPISKVQAILGEIEIYHEIQQFIADHIDDCYILTGNIDVWVNQLISRFGCVAYTSEAYYQNDDLLGVKSILDKGEATKQIKSRYNTVVAVGDGMNDVPMMEHADVKIAFGGSRLPVEGLITITDYVVFHERSLCNVLRQFT